uniref:NADH-ubiquinone oxidoreductase chain 1 n=1 Tax=Strigamia maritima TaxID=126957 RepID=A0A0C5B177_STRMM|nr:NADH dehydrogenase subunit 1 [Strigamia maritima]AJK90884.1 NADH dehydrogenase subunit 1 [Strigamia maritima]
MLLGFFDYVFLIVCVLLSVAFFTLFERSGLGYAQIRRGPTSVGPSSLFQPFSDAIKLLVSEIEQPSGSNFIPYFFCPVLSLFLFLAIWEVVPFLGGGGQITFSLLFFLCIVGVGSYVVMGSGWFSNSKYALLGCLRFIAQAVSYEVSLALVIIILALVAGGYSMSGFLGAQFGGFYFFLFFSPAASWVVIMLAESNRTPFDFAEGESELVSGFNVEYGGGGFALLFMAEYARMLMMSFFFCGIFIGGVIELVCLPVIAIVFLFIWVRGLLPRLRYDVLMYLAWKDLLPLTICYFIFVVGLFAIYIF